MKSSTLELLEKSELPPAQARAIFQAMEAEFSVHDGVLATKADLAELRLATKEDMARLEIKFEAMRVDVIRWNFAFWVAQLAAMAALFKLLK